VSVTKVGKNKYRIFISDGFNLDGSRRRFSKTITTDLKGRDLERFLILREIEFEEEVKKRDPQFHKLATGTFEEYSVWWLEYIDVAPKTKEEYRKLLTTRILKFIGHKKLDKLTTGDMIELMKLIEESPARTKSGRLSANSINHYHTLLKIMFNDAVKLEILEKYPMASVPAKKVDYKVRDNYYDLEDVKKMLKFLSKEQTKYQLITFIALSVGARIGEITALQWRHIDLQNMRLTIEQSNSYTKEKGTIIKVTKNPSSIRVVDFPNYLVNVFLKHMEEEKLKMELKGTDWIYHDKPFEENFVFTQENGKVMHVHTPTKWFSDFIERNKLKPVTLHGLRHTNATILIDKGVNIVSIANRLGHAKPSTTTDIYGHHLKSTEREIANTFDEIIDDKKESGSESGTKEGNLKIVK